MPSPYQSGHNQENKTAINSANREFHKIGDLSNGRVEKPTGDRWLEPRSDNTGGPERGEEPLLVFTPSAPPSGQIQAQPGNTAWWGVGQGVRGQQGRARMEQGFNQTTALTMDVPDAVLSSQREQPTHSWEVSNVSS